MFMFITFLGREDDRRHVRGLERERGAKWGASYSAWQTAGRACAHRRWHGGCGHALPLRTRPAQFAGFRQRANVNGLTAAEHRPIAVIVTAAVTVTVTAAVTVALIVTVDVAFTVTRTLALTLTLTLTDH